MATTPPLTKDSGQPLSDPLLYRQIVSVLQYATFTRLDITFTVNRLCKYMHKPTNVHWAIVKCLLCYLKDTAYYQLFFFSTSNIYLQYLSDID